MVVATRGPLIESTHPVTAAVVAADGTVLATSGVPGTTFWRSAAKPFQVLPLVEQGGLDRWPIDRQMLALACGSHNAEPMHREVAARWLAALDLSEEALACGGHPSLSSRVAEEMIRTAVHPGPLWSNCSGKHAALLAQGRLHDWPIAGYEVLGHPVQDAVSASIARWSGLPEADLQWGVDGCTAAAVALPLRAMALAYARLGASQEPGATALRQAMMSEPLMVAGTDRLDSVLMASWPGRVLAKAGAEGVFCAALPGLGVGLALKVLDGDMRSAAIALVATIRQVVEALAPGGEWPTAALTPWIEPAISNTRGQVTGHYRVTGGLRFS